MNPFERYFMCNYLNYAGQKQMTVNNKHSNFIYAFTHIKAGKNKKFV